MVNAHWAIEKVDIEFFSSANSLQRIFGRIKSCKNEMYLYNSFSYLLNLSYNRVKGVRAVPTK